ncbi:formate dehydrogenase subunit alpha [Cupriavidus taiwanensis]|uniref:nitrate reductase (cytochrome) n=1 Tax=Cupriavidus taiwanensis TaxID=164546 RepID=A0A375J8X9_9BURK|nr:formate dehydrogenase subunit alpha [Cupriavidus taiwanensis]SPS00066.1 putative formate dehydrogenase alpha subunit [Cupriavidus taiwanensis]
MPTLTIDGKVISAPSGQSVLEAARAHGIEIPTLCHHSELTTTGSCRLCLVEIEGENLLAAACALVARPDMVVRTSTPRVMQARRAILGMLLLRYDEAAQPDCESEFMRWVREYGARRPVAPPNTGARHVADEDPNPFIRVDLNKCILCTRCVRACEEVQVRFVWGVAGRGEASRLVAGVDSTMLEARCEFCGACAAVCPTGALADRSSLSDSKGAPTRTVTTVCPYCGVGCGFDLNVREGKVVRVSSSKQAPVNGMRLCVKGRYGYGFLHDGARLQQPQVRRYLLEGRTRAPDEPRDEWITVDWNDALEVVARRFAAIGAESGGNALGILASAKCTNEENYLLQKFARQVLGTHNVDHCARLCHASTVSGLSMAYGSGAMSNTLADVAGEAAAVFLIGANPTEQHPVFGTMLRQAVRKRHMPLVVADPRAIGLTEFAAMHLRHWPGTDVALVNGLMHIILANRWHDAEFIAQRTEGFSAWQKILAAYTPARVSAITRVSEEELTHAASLLAHAKPMAVVWAMGITQHTSGVLNVLALANLQMLLGNVGVRGGGVNPLRGQNNVQGACDMGALPNQFPGYQGVGDAAVRKEFAAAWALKHGHGRYPRFGNTAGLTVTEMINASGQRILRALYIVGENPAATDPDLNHVRRSLQSAEFVVLQEIFPSDTAEFADVLLPGAAWAEKSGTFTNTERRVQRVRQAIDPPGRARPDWEIVRELAQRMLALQGRTPAGPQAGWDYTGPDDILTEVTMLCPPYAGITPARLSRGETLHWPVPDTSHPGTPILHRGSFSRGKGKFHIAEYLPPEELPDADYPLLLTTGRVLAHWHAGEMTRRVPGLLELYPQPLVEISPEDAARLNVAHKQPVRLASRRGEMQALAQVTDRVPPGVVFGNFHFPGEANVNNLTHSALDPVAKIPEFKVCAVRLVDFGTTSGKPPAV